MGHLQVTGFEILKLFHKPSHALYHKTLWKTSLLFPVADLTPGLLLVSSAVVS